MSSRKVYAFFISHFPFLLSLAFRFFGSHLPEGGYRNYTAALHKAIRQKEKHLCRMLIPRKK